MSEPLKKNPDKSPWALVGEGTQLAVTVLLCLYIGYRIDEAKGTSPLFTLILAGLGLFIGLYSFIVRVSKK